jgi:hypothetical protein
MQKNSTPNIITVSNKPTTSEQLETKESAPENRVQTQYFEAVNTSSFFRITQLGVYGKHYKNHKMKSQERKINKTKGEFIASR